MKKILQVCAIDVSVNLLLKPLIHELMRQGNEVHIACTDTGYFDELREQGFNMIHIPIERKIKPISNLISVCKLYALMNKEKYDVVHLHTPIASVLGRIAAKAACVKNIIYTAHGFYFHEGMNKLTYQMFYRLEKFFARYLTDWLLLQSREDYLMSIEKDFKNKERIIHIGNGVDIHSKFKPELIDSHFKNQLKNKLNIGNDDIVICFIGRIVKEKGIFELFESFCLLNETHKNIKLLLIGDILPSERIKEGNYLQEVRNNSNIVSVGFRNDIPELLAISDIFVLPSYREGLPRSIIEAMAMGKPIVATNIRGCREEVFDQKNGFLVEKGNGIDLYEKLKILIEDTNLREKFGQNSRQIVEKDFDEKKVIEKQMELFIEL